MQPVMFLKGHLLVFCMSRTGACNSLFWLFRSFRSFCYLCTAAEKTCFATFGANPTCKLNIIFISPDRYRLLDDFWTNTVDFWQFFTSFASYCFFTSFLTSHDAKMQSLFRHRYVFFLSIELDIELWQMTRPSVSPWSRLIDKLDSVRVAAQWI